MIIRQATLDEREAITQLIAESARHLSREHYSDRQIDAAIATVFGVDTDLIDDGTYFVVEISGALVGCGGWSRRKRSMEPRNGLHAFPWASSSVSPAIPPS